MSQHPLLCEHCGYPFDAKRTVKGPVICPACGLVAHPHGIAATAPNCAQPGPTRVSSILRMAWAILILVLLLFNLYHLLRLRNDVRILSKTATHPDDEMLLMNTAEAPNNGEAPAIPDESQAIQEIALRDVLQNALSEEELRQYTYYSNKLAERYPPYAVNDFIKLRQLNGLIQRGQFIGLKDDAVLLLQNGVIQNILLAQLDRDSRMRIDTVFREKAIQFQMNKELKTPNEAHPSSSGR